MSALPSPSMSAAADAGADPGATAGSALAKATADATIAHHSKSFSLAAKILPARCRDDAAIVYTYCRRVDDAIDEVAPAVAATAVATLRAELDQLYTGPVPDDPVLARFAAIVNQRRIPRHYPAELIAGMEMDALGTSYQSVDDLVQYAYRVAGVGGLMMCHVMGVRDDSALVPATHLGIAMQLTNICRDVAEDWRRGRLYLPTELLARHHPDGHRGVAELSARAAAGETFPALAGPVFSGAMKDLLVLADRYYRSADKGIASLSVRSAFGVRAARKIYSAIGTRIAGADFDPVAPRAIVPHWRKLGLVGAAALGTLADLPRRLRWRDIHIVPTTTLELSDVARL